MLALNINASEIENLNNVETLTVDSKILKTTFPLSITLPVGYQHHKSKRYPIIFALHPRSKEYLHGIYDWLSHNAQQPWVNSIIVTPAVHHKELMQLITDTTTQPENSKLLTFFEKEVLAAVDDTYRTNGFRVFSGFMRNGAVGLYSLLNKPDIFNAYIISSPTLANDLFKINSQASIKLSTLNDKIRMLYIAQGNHRFEQPHQEAVDVLHSTLSKVAPEQLEWRITQESSHFMSRPLVNIIESIEHIFADLHRDLAANSEISKKGADAIIEYYKDLSDKKYGFPVSAEGSLSKLANSMVESSPSDAIKLYKRIITLYPQSAFAFNNLAAIYDMQGEVEKVLLYQRQAVEYSKGLQKWQQDRLQATLADYEQKYGG